MHNVRKLDLIADEGAAVIDGELSATGLNALMRGRGLFQPGTVLPIIPPPEDDELISSWLDRTTQFYGQPINALLRRDCKKPLDLAAVDLGISQSALKSVARLLGVSTAILQKNTIGSSYPWATEIVARESHEQQASDQPLRYSACSHCLEEQRVRRGVSWLRRDWVFAPRTICPTHFIPLGERNIGSREHPVWSDFLHRHNQLAISTCAIYRSDEPSAIVTAKVQDDGFDLHRDMAVLQEEILTDLAGNRICLRNVDVGRARVVADLIWAFSRQLRHHSDRIIYEAYMSNVLDSLWHMTRRRRPGSVPFTTMHMRERHALFATATVLTRPPDYQRKFYAPFIGPPDIDNMPQYLTDADQAEWRRRKGRWQWNQKVAAA